MACHLMVLCWLIMQGILYRLVELEDHSVGPLTESASGFLKS
jgi:hypothetical protein